MSTRRIAFTIPLTKKIDLLVIGFCEPLPWSEGSDRYHIDYDRVMYDEKDILPLLEYEREVFGECRLLDKIEETTQETCYGIQRNIHNKS